MDRRVAGDGFTASHASVVGHYTYLPASDSWTWSDEVFRIHGFEPHEVVPTSALVLRHIHADDRATAKESRAAALERQQPFSLLHRIITAQGQERVVMSAGHVERGPDGGPVVSGHLIDLTEVRRSAVDDELDDAVVDFLAHRAVIEQAKGVLTQLYSVDPDTAFAILRVFSMHTHTRIREVADHLVAAASVDDTPTKGLAPSAHDMLERLLPGRGTAQA